MVRTIPTLMALFVCASLAAAPKIVATSVQPSCSTTVTNCSNIPVSTLATNNGIVITLEPLTHSFYNAKAPGLLYSIYDMNGILVTSFSCTRSTVKFHSQKLLDATPYKILITAPGAASPYYEFTTATNQPCKGVKSPLNERHE